MVYDDYVRLFQMRIIVCAICTFLILALALALAFAVVRATEDTAQNINVRSYQMCYRHSASGAARKQFKLP